VYPNPQVAEFIHQNFLPVKVHIKEQPASFHRFEANWTPTVMVMDPEGRERYRFSGYLPAEEFIAQLMMGLGKREFAHKRWSEAERWFRQIMDKYPNSDMAPEAMYWAGVSRYKASNDHNVLGETAKQFQNRYSNTSWALRSSVWLPKAA
jgi:hypothetical protein